MAVIDYAFLRSYVPLYHDRRPGKDGAPGYPFATNQQQILFWLSIYLEPALERWKIDTDLRKAHFIAQARAESFDFTTTTEFGANFQQNDGTSYENRSDLGNTRPGDGARFIGRGIIQTTGRANYRDLSRKLSLNAVPDRTPTPESGTLPYCNADFFGFLAHPEKVAAFPAAIYSACFFWIKNDLNIWADKDDSPNITLIVNGSRSDADRRRKYTDIAKRMLNSQPLAFNAGWLGR